MEVRDSSVLAVIFVTLFYGFNSSVLSGLAGFGLSPIHHDICEGKHSDLHTCYVTQVTNISCFNAVINADNCKTHSQTFNSNASSSNNGGHGLTNWTHLQSYYHRHSGGRHRPGNIGLCLELKPGVCNQYQCLKQCCEGWKEDKNGVCNIHSGVPTCRNGGSSNGKGRNCHCLPGFSGKHCEKVLCPGECLNNGKCIVHSEGENVCLCPQNVYGKNCQRIQCKYVCENGGKCVMDGPTPTCRCQPGFYGRNCAHSFEHDSSCPPPNNTVCVDLNCKDECQADSTCPFGYVCCSDGCCLKCVRPRPQGCLHNGVLHQPLSIFRKDNCTECSCYHNGSTKCYTSPVSFEDYPCCVSDCTGKTTPMQNVHRRPRINCSNDVIELPVFRFSRNAYMRDLHIQAKDENGTSLRVRYTPPYIFLQRVPISQRNTELIEVFARDSLGQTSQCSQNVLIVDRTHPEFVSCPTDTEVKTSYPVTSASFFPKARDNVGVQFLSCNPPARKEYRPGTYMIFCTAIDYDGNKAYCRTTVKVIRTGSTDHTPPIFMSCPLNIYVSEGEWVTWKEPRAYDHTGVLSLESNYDSNTVFPVGWTSVIYTATDFNHNKGYCTFSVLVTRKSTYPTESSPTSMSDSVRLIIAVVSSLAVIVVILLVLVMLWRRFRNKPVQRSRSSQLSNDRNQTTIPTISNALYESTAMGLDGHPIVPTLKPPPYSPAIEPPSYEEVYTNPCLQNEVTDEEYSRVTDNVYSSVTDDNSREDPPPYEPVS